MIAIHHDGVVLEAPYGQELWLPKFEFSPPLRPEEPILLAIGQQLFVRVLRIAEMTRSRYLVSLRAMAEPFIEDLSSGRRVSGVLDHQLNNGEYMVLLDPVPRVSSSPFWARTEGCQSLTLPLKSRVLARVSRVQQKRWLLIVKEIVASKAE